MIMKFAVILALFALYVAPIAGIKCYVCEGACSGKGAEKDCPSDKTCAKIVQEGLGIGRSCDREAKLACATHEKTTTCNCNTDLCNTATLQRSPSTFLLGAVGVLTFLFNALASRLN